MDKKRTIKDIQKEMEELHNKTKDRKKELSLEIQAIDFKIQILDKIYQEEKNKLEQEQIKITENEVRKELGL